MPKQKKSKAKRGRVRRQEEALAGLAKHYGLFLYMEDKTRCEFLSVRTGKPVFYWSKKSKSWWLVYNSNLSGKAESAFAAIKAVADVYNKLNMAY